MAAQNNEPQRDQDWMNIIDQRIRELDQQQLCNFNPSEERSAHFIISIANIFAEFSVRLFPSADPSLSGEIELDLRHLDDGFYEIFKQWLRKRKELIKCLRSSADELDKRFKIVTTNRLIGSSLDLFYNVDSVSENAISGMITNQAFGISKSLGMASLIFFKCLPHFAYMGLVSTFVDSTISKISMKNILKVNGEDSRSFEAIDDWMREREVIDPSIRQHFPNGFRLDASIARKTEEVLSDYEEDIKIFTTAILSNIRENLNFSQVINGIWRFSQTDAARESYGRSVRGVHPIGMEMTRLEYRNQLLQLSIGAPEIPLEIVKLAPEIHVNQRDSRAAEKELINLKLRYVPHFILGALNCYYIYSSCRDLRDGIQHQHSELLRNMSEQADRHMRIVIAFMNLQGRS